MTVSPWKTLTGRVPCSTFDALNPPPIGASFACNKKHEVSNPKLIPALHKNFIEQHIEPLSTLFNVVTTHLTTPKNPDIGR